jgi:hypothetical protein
MNTSSKFLFDPVKYSFYRLICDYFSDPFVQKVRQDDNYSVYVCRIQTLLLNEYRYIVIISQADQFAIGSIKPLSELKWVSFQTRTLASDTYYNVTTHSYDIKNDMKYHFLVKQTSSNIEKSTYEFLNFEFPVQITLLHVKGHTYEYPPNGSLVSCLETYQTVMTFIEN